jgi:hypothetical protein
VLHFPVRFDSWYRGISLLAFIRPSSSFINVGDEINVHMGWAFDATFPRSAIARLEAGPASVLSRGVHGWDGRWLVNGSGYGLVTFTLDPEQSARMSGIRVRLRELIVSVDDPVEFIAAVTAH